MFFLIIMAVGIILGEVLFPQEGVRGQGTVITNDTDCLENLIGNVIHDTNSNNSTQMVAVVLGPWISHLDERAEP